MTTAPASGPSRALCLEEFALHSFDKLRYGDTDRQGHVNNAVFATLLETGRVELFHQGPTLLMDTGCSLVIAHLSVDYLRELHWPGRVDIGTRVLSIGRSSLRLEQALFQDKRPVARAETVVVQVSNETRRGHALSQELVARLAPLRFPLSDSAVPP